MTGNLAIKRQGSEAAWGAGLAACALLASAHGARAEEAPAERPAVTKALKQHHQPRPAQQAVVPGTAPQHAATPGTINRISSRAQKIRDKITHFQDSVRNAGLTISAHLNNNPLGHDEHSGTLGDSTWQMKTLTFSVEPEVELLAGRPTAALRVRAQALKTELDHPFQVGTWTLSTGVRGEVLAEGILATGGNYFADRSPLNRLGVYVGPTAEAFGKGEGDLGGWHLSTTVATGTGLDVAHGGDPLAYVRGSLQATGSPLSGGWLSGSQPKIRIDEAVMRDMRGGIDYPSHRIFVGMSKPMQLSFKGHEKKVDVEFGVQDLKNPGQRSSLGPHVSFHFHS